jgi:hypothetical protein
MNLCMTTIMTATNIYPLSYSYAKEDQDCLGCGHSGSIRFIFKKLRIGGICTPRRPYTDAWQLNRFFRSSIYTEAVSNCTALVAFHSASAQHSHLLSVLGFQTLVMEAAELHEQPCFFASWILRHSRRQLNSRHSSLACLSASWILVSVRGFWPWQGLTSLVRRFWPRQGWTSKSSRAPGS